MQKHPRITAFLVLLLCLNACNQADKADTESTDATNLEDSITGGLDRLNYMRLHDGQFRTGNDYGVPNTSREDLAKTFDSLKKQDNSIVIYFHGGFIPIKKAYTEPLSDGFDNAFRQGDHFPFYILYGNGLGNTVWVYLQNLFFNDEEEGPALLAGGAPKDFADSVQLLFKKKSFQYILGQVSRKFDQSDGITSQDYQPYRDTVNLETIILNELNRQSLVKSVDLSFLDNPSQDSVFEQQLYDDDTLQDLARKDWLEEQPASLSPDSVAGFNFIRALYNVIKISKGVRLRYKTNRDHDPAMTIAEEILYNSNYLLIIGIKKIAQQGWSTSKTIVSNAFLQGDNHGGTALLKELTEINQQARLANKTKHIWLVGSSTGTIMICELLKASKKPGFSNLRFNIIFSVASCSMELFSEALDAAKHKIDKFYLFGLNRDNERMKPKKGLWPGSILFLVSSVCESEDNPYHDKPLVGMQRFYKDDFRSKARFTEKEDSLIKRVSAFFKMKDSYNRNVIWSNDRGRDQDPNLNNYGLRHSGVIRDSAVQASITYLLKQSN